MNEYCIPNFPFLEPFTRRYSSLFLKKQYKLGVALENLDGLPSLVTTIIPFCQM
jgi:hypothetical protein